MQKKFELFINTIKTILSAPQVITDTTNIKNNTSNSIEPIIQSVAPNEPSAKEIQFLNFIKNRDVASMISSLSDGYQLNTQDVTAILKQYSTHSINQDNISEQFKTNMFIRDAMNKAFTQVVIPQQLKLFHEIETKNNNFELLKHDVFSDEIRIASLSYFKDIPSNINIKERQDIYNYCERANKFMMDLEQKALLNSQGLISNVLKKHKIDNSSLPHSVQNSLNQIEQSYNLLETKTVSIPQKFRLTFNLKENLNDIFNQYNEDKSNDNLLNKLSKLSSTLNHSLSGTPRDTLKM